MSRHHHRAVPEVLRGETSWGFTAREDVLHGIRLTVTSGAKVRLRNANGTAVVVQARAVARPQLRKCGMEIAVKGNLSCGDRGARRLRTRLGFRFARCAATAAVWRPLIVERCSLGSAEPSASRKPATAGRKADCSRGTLDRGPGSCVTKARDGCVGRSAPARNWAQSIARWCDRGRVEVSECRC